MDLLERAALLDELGRLLGEAAAGQGRLVLLGGEAGIGKTSLVQRFCSSIPSDVRLLEGACDPLSTPRPLGPLIDMAPTIGGELLRLVTTGAPRDELFRAFLAELAGSPRTVLGVFEDVHWADEATLDLLRFLGRRIGPTRSLLIATYRADEVGRDHPLRTTLGDLATSASVRRLSLPPLTEDAVRALVEPYRLDPARVYRQTSGNPFFVAEILADGTDDVPPTVRDAVLARAARLSPAGRTALETAAVIGPWIDRTLLAQVAEVNGADSDECVAAGMLRPDGPDLCFRHELVRDAVFEALPPERRVGLHRAVLAALRADPAYDDDVALLAHHAEGAEDGPAVLEYARAAGRQAAELGAHREAAAQYGRALRFAAGMPIEERALLLEARAYECHVTSQSEAAIVARQAALATWRTLRNPRKEGENLCWLSRLYWNADRAAKSAESVRAAITLLETLPPDRELAMAYSYRSSLHTMTGEHAEAVTWGEKAITLAEQLGDTETIAYALSYVGMARLETGDAEGREILQRGARLAREADLGVDAMRAVAFLASHDVCTYQFAPADRGAQDGLAYCVERDLDYLRVALTGIRGLSQVYQGRWADAEEALAPVVAHRQGPPAVRLHALVALGLLRARQGNPDASAILDEALTLGRMTIWSGLVRVVRAEAAWLAGDLDRTRAEARVAYDRAVGRQNPWLNGQLAYWLWRAAELREPPTGIPEPFALQIAGEWAKAAARWQALGCPYEAAEALADGDDEAALREALATFERLGARPAAERVARRLHQLGVQNHTPGDQPAAVATTADDGADAGSGARRAGRYPDGLTEREAEVLRLVAAGHTNKEIARALFVSTRTVESHLFHVYAKIGARRRADAAAYLARLGLN